MENENSAIIKLNLEDFKEPLIVKISKTIDDIEFNDLTTELLRNYILNLKDRKKIPDDRNDLILINKVKSYDNSG